ncbi:Malate dehydrogenase OS=Streptomyces fumanus OX=67302 GN=sfcA PE=3 SV=1 [Streptomyces fumanus]
MAAVSKAIAREPELAERYTWAGRLVAVVTDGTAVLGLGNVGPAAALPVMEGKAALLKQFGGLDAIPLVLDTTDVDEIVDTLVRLRPSFGAVSLEDVAAPRCFTLEERLTEALDCPVMHDDQHGTAIAVLAALRGACAVGRPLTRQRVVVCRGRRGRGRLRPDPAGGGPHQCHRAGLAGHPRAGRPGLNPAKAALAGRTNPRRLRGGLAEALRGAHASVGASSATVPEELIASMARTRSSWPCPIPYRSSTPASPRGTPRWWAPGAATSPPS